MKAKCAKKKLLEAFKNYPQSIRKLSAAYESFLKSRKAKEILSETDIACALERHKCGDWGEISPEDWARCNACMEMGYGYVYSRHKTAGNRYFCIITYYSKPKTRIVTEEELLNAGGNSTGAVHEKSQSYPLKKAG